MVVIWAASGFGYFWPIWVWFGLSIPVAIQYAIRRSLKGPRQWRGAVGPRRRCRASRAAILTFIWAVTGFGFWLFWPLFGLAVALVSATGW